MHNNSYNLRRYISISILLVLEIFCLGCTDSQKTKDSGFYAARSIELIEDIIKSYDYECSCILEPTNHSLLETLAIETPASNFNEEIIEALQIENDSVLMVQDKLSENFTIDRMSILPNSKLIRRKEIDSLLRENYANDHREKLWEQCPDGWFSFSRPIFNENFNIAILNISFCSPGGSYAIYKLINDKWELRGRIISWIS